MAVASFLAVLSCTLLAPVVGAASPLEVDLTYGIFRGYTNPTAGLNIWKGYAAVRESLFSPTSPSKNVPLNLSPFLSEFDMLLHQLVPCDGKHLVNLRQTVRL